MPSVDDKSLDGEEPLEPPSHNLSPALHSAAFSGMPMHVYPFPNALLPAQQPLRSKRRQVKNACTHCQKACKKCDDARPCLRCVKYGISEECVDSQRKERKKGVKRGPYKKRDGKGSSVEHIDVPPQGMTVSNSVPPPGGPPIPGPYMPLGYPPGFYGQYPPLAAKPGEAPPMYSSPPYFLTSVPTHLQPQLHGVQEGETQAYGTHGFYQAAVLTPMPYHPQYAISRPDGTSIPNQYYSGPVYPKQSPGGGEVFLLLSSKTL
ncbi:hypothetical protein GALMADRAFT_221259 [Galerina marginata CBS 339.88]|uniref:Transcription activator of gluconeogenesis ERT1 n=1 Tax=Galerina marginata (strain CBS 339.88) TaxID=685588 RepID=A0A067TR14_GALM3|nr:hypothetical protein GALMADRAFT_221259 [Galerina marginata CBS 339.88]